MAGSDAPSDYKLYQYDPSMVAAVIFIILFLVTSLLHTYQLVRTRTWYFIPFCIGIYCTFLSNLVPYGLWRRVDRILTCVE